MSSPKLITGNANPDLARQIADRLNEDLSPASITRFKDGEIGVDLRENMRGEDAFVVQPTGPPANDNLMELLILIDTLRRASAGRITAVLPYMGYARQDRKTASRTPITAKLVANQMTAAGADRILTCDLHVDQIQGFWDSPTDHLFAAMLFARDIARVPKKGHNRVVVSPDVGGVKRARYLAQLLDCELAIIDKRRQAANESEVMNVIGNVDGADCILVDDIIDTAGTICRAADVLRSRGAASVSAYATHGVLSDPALDRISRSSFDEVVVTDTLPGEQANETPGIRRITTANLFAQAIEAIHTHRSISKLFKCADSTIC